MQTFVEVEMNKLVEQAIAAGLGEYLSQNPIEWECRKSSGSHKSRGSKKSHGSRGKRRCRNSWNWN